MTHWRPIDKVLAALALLLCLHLLQPALHAVQLEGFTAQTQSIALLQAVAPGVAHDPDMPMVTQFITQSRGLVVAALAGVYKLAPDASDLAFQGLVLLSFVVLCAASLALARRWGSTPWPLAALALVLAPGAVEVSFFFNDNIVSAALAVGGLWMLHPRCGLLRCALAGALWALAVLARIDAVFMAPLLLGSVLLRVRGEGRRERRQPPWGALAVAGGSALAVLAAAALWQGFTLLDAVHTSRQFVIDRPGTRWLSTRVLFFGAITLPLLAIGGWLMARALWAERRVLQLCTWVVYPVLLALLAPRATETRYIFPLLTPFVALHAGRGLAVVLERCRHGFGRGSWASWGVVAWTLFVLCAPPTLVLLHDGPRSVLGRLWSPAMWADWQRAVDTSNTRQRALAQALASQRSTLLVSTHFNDEWFMRLRLFELGYVPDAAHGSVAGCHGLSVYRRGESQVLHVRTEPQYGLAPIDIQPNAALQLGAALTCPSLPLLDAAYVTTFGLNTYGIDADLYGFWPNAFPGPLEMQFPDSLMHSPYKAQLKVGYTWGLFSAKPLPLRDLPGLATRALARQPKDLDIETYRQRYRATPGPTQALLATLRERLPRAHD